MYISRKNKMFIRSFGKFSVAFATPRLIGYYLPQLVLFVIGKLKNGHENRTYKAIKIYLTPLIVKQVI